MWYDVTTCNYNVTCVCHGYGIHSNEAEPPNVGHSIQDKLLRWMCPFPVLPIQQHLGLSEIWSIHWLVIMFTIFFQWTISTTSITGWSLLFPMFSRRTCSLSSLKLLRQTPFFSWGWRWRNRRIWHHGTRHCYLAVVGMNSELMMGCSTWKTNCSLEE